MSTEEKEILESTNEEIEETEETEEKEIEETEEFLSTEEGQVTSETISYTDNELLNLIHNDLGIITCFLIFFVLVIILKYIYKFFNMIFPY